MNRKIKYGIVGSGNFAGVHLEGIKGVHDIEVIAICDPHVESCYPYAEKYGIPKENCFDDYKKLLAMDEIEAVVVATNDQTHAEISIAAMRAGKHVLCEKPMSLDLDECKEMIKTSDETGKKLMVGQICRMTPAFVEAKRLVEIGLIGDLYFVESEYAHDYKHIPGVDGWRQDPKRHPIIGGACHAIDLLRWIVGDPIETTSYSNHKVLTDWPVDDCTVAIFKFPDNIIGKVFCSMGCKREYTMRTCLYGTKGTLIFDNTTPYITLYADRCVENGYMFDGALWYGDNAKEDSNYNEHYIPHMIPVDIDNHNSAEENRLFVQAIMNDTPVPTDGREGAKTVAVCKAVVESSRLNAPVKIDYDF